MTSEKYPNDGLPHGGSGVPGTFTFKANGSPDVVGYCRRFGDAYHYIPAPSPGADVTLEYTPTSFSDLLSVRSVDSASTSSETVHYEFRVKSTAPQVEVTMAGIGLPSRLAVSTNVEGVTEFGYRIGDGAETWVPVNPDGPTEIPVTFAEGASSRSRSAATPGANSSAGTPRTYRSATSRPWSRTTSTSPSTTGWWTVPAPSRSARPDRCGGVRVHVRWWRPAARRRGRGRHGGAALDAHRGWLARAERPEHQCRRHGLETQEQQFNVIDTKPYVSSSTYYENGAWGGVGIPGEFNFDTGMPDVDAYLYRLNDGPEQVVDPDYSWARVTLTPDRSGSNTLTVRTRFQNGSFSPARTYTFEVSDAPVVTSEDYPANGEGGQPGQTGRFTFNPGRSGVTEYRYVLEYTGEEQVVAAGADGRATVEITPTHSGYTLLTVTSRTADGTVSPERRYYFRVRDARVNVSSAYDEYSPRRGIGSVGTFGVYTEISEVTTFEYQLNGGAWQSVPKKPDALATDITVTMDRNGANLISFRGRTAAGDYTPQTDYPFLVGTAPLVSWGTYPAGQWSGGMGVAGEFTFTRAARV
ncbi:hypothetical protein V2I01_16705 [Micromonospora sp. BRA006-A]|nr:hypothetical protein [Micromonospora sp. BRA006-A]